MAIFRRVDCATISSGHCTDASTRASISVTVVVQARTRLHHEHLSWLWDSVQGF